MHTYSRSASNTRAAYTRAATTFLTGERDIKRKKDARKRERKRERERERERE
jgi:hypothetical protein